MADPRWDVPQTEEGLQTVLERLAESRAAGDEEQVGWGLLALAFQVIWVRSDNEEPPFVRCGTLATEALEIFRRIGHVKGQIAAIHRLVPSLGPERKNQMVAEADRLAIASGDEVLVARSLAAQARQLAMSDRAGASELARRALEIFLRHDEKRSAAGCCFSLSIQLDDSRAKYEVAIQGADLYRAVGDRKMAAHILSIAEMNGEEFMPYTDLEPIIRQELEDAQAAGSRLREQAAYGHLAKLAAVKGDAEEAAKYLRWEKELEEADGVTPKERHRANIAMTKEMIRMAKTSGNEETVKVFEEELKRLKKLHVK